MENITDEQISLLVDISQKTPLELDPERRRLIEALLTAGFITPSNEDDAKIAPYELTAKAERFLSERGAGLNEA